ncbi:MAG: DNA-formamidopyrimidine glycosylase family protein [Myxococcaceae bacterium]|nr:DNA-formamidopyrimidine glycosylase family protein [Myxococcaceae bacterium]
MPEGDTLRNIATTLSPLVGQRVTALEFPRAHADGSAHTGALVERVESKGKNLLVSFSSGSVLHVHLKMTGVVHLYATGERWRRSRGGAVVVLRVPGFEAVVFRAPVVRLLSRAAARRDGPLNALGPDLLDPAFDENEALRRLRLDPARPLGVAVMDQTAVSGIGNVYKSEVLFNLKLDPFCPVADVSDDRLLAVLRHARALLQKNTLRTALEATPVDAYRVTRTTRRAGRAPLSVYGRVNEACFDCGATIAMRRQGEQRRSTYFCPVCQGVEPS